MITTNDILENVVKFIDIGQDDRIVIRDEKYGYDVTIYFWDKPSCNYYFRHDITMQELKSRIVNFAEYVEASHSNV